MTRSPDDPLNSRRRALLRRIGLGAAMAYAAPGLTVFSVARASGGSGGGSGSGSGPSGASGPSGPSGPSERGEGRSSQSGQRRSSQRAQPARRPARPPPEIVALVPLAQSLQPAIDIGYRVLSQSVSPATGAVVARFSLPPSRSLDDGIAELARLLPGALTDANDVYRPDALTCDGEDCAAHAMIGWAGWPSALRPRLGMIDTGINTDHPALQGRRLTVHQVDLADRDAAGRQHGTAIAAMLVGTVDGRVPGLLPDAELIAVEAFHRSAGTEQADAFSLVKALDILIEARVDVINLSFSGPANEVLARVIARAAEAGIGLVAAAGNGGPGAEPAYPAAWPEVIAVTAVDAQERVYRQANQGPYVMLAAPGVNIWAAASISGGRLRSGTSYAAPFVTAVLAAERLRAPLLGLEAVTQHLFSCARDLGQAGFDPVYGHGLVSAPGQCRGAGALFSVSGE
jgi:hypothetical protein